MRASFCPRGLNTVQLRRRWAYEACDSWLSGFGFAVRRREAGESRSDRDYSGHQIYYPDLSTLQQDYGSQLVNPTAFFSLFEGETTTITNTQIIYTSPAFFGTYIIASFNGYVFDFFDSGTLITKRDG